MCVCTAYDEVVIGMTAPKAHLIGTSFFIYTHFLRNTGPKRRATWLRQQWNLHITWRHFGTI